MEEPSGGKETVPKRNIIMLHFLSYGVSFI